MELACNITHVNQALGTKHSIIAFKDYFNQPFITELSFLFTDLITLCIVINKQILFFV